LSNAPKDFLRESRIQPDDPRHFVERSQMLPRNSEDIECSEVSRLAPRLQVELRADAPNEFRPTAFRRKHAGQKKQFARLNSFHIGAETVWVARGA
jgi:hypothetical protein